MGRKEQRTCTQVQKHLGTEATAAQSAKYKKQEPQQHDKHKRKKQKPQQNDQQLIMCKKQRLLGGLSEALLSPLPSKALLLLHLLPTTLVTPHLGHRVTLPLSSLSACLFVFSPGPHSLQCAASRQPRHDCTSTPSPKSWANCHDAETLGAQLFYRKSEQVKHAMPLITLKLTFQKTMEKLLNLTRTVNLTSLSMSLSLLLPALTKMVLAALCSVIIPGSLLPNWQLQKHWPY